MAAEFWAGVESALMVNGLPSVGVESVLVGDVVPLVRVEISSVNVEFFPIGEAWPAFALRCRSSMALVFSPVGVAVTPDVVESTVESAARGAFPAEVSVLVSAALARMDVPAGFTVVFLSSTMWRTSGVVFLVRRCR